MRYLTMLVMSCTVTACGGLLSPDGLAHVYHSATESLASLTTSASGRQTSAQPVVPYLPLKEVCITSNEQVAIPDFVPALRQLLDDYGLVSRVYARGTTPHGCAELTYTAMLRPVQQIQSTRIPPTLASASLTLRRDGTLLSAASFEEHSPTDDWRDTVTRLAQLVDTLLSGKQSPLVTCVYGDHCAALAYEQTP
ncbi:hypothetical protein GCM10010971_06650 [Silvimonas amylolytica]|uniref:Lipoprotein n=1 Tax=Silvimonas amylolytica TaxID=449663 RepID=A0ABQ2PHY3_9NEIS|nr:hypothetical protein GCM10010971_06650 [Silvimonas amylolytica]